MRHCPCAHTQKRRHFHAKTTVHWWSTQSAGDFEIPLCHIPPFRSFFFVSWKPSGTTRAVGGIRGTDLAAPAVGPPPPPQQFQGESMSAFGSGSADHTEPVPGVNNGPAPTDVKDSIILKMRTALKMLKKSVQYFS